MAAVHSSISPDLRAFIERQHVFFVATAPSSPEGHVNISPKGLDSFRVITPTSVAYLDLTGSGNETATHVAQNGRIADNALRHRAAKIVDHAGGGYAAKEGEGGGMAGQELLH